MTFGEGDLKLTAVGHVLRALDLLTQDGDVAGVAQVLDRAEVCGLQKCARGCVVHAYIAKGWSPATHGASFSVGSGSINIEFRDGSRLVLDTPDPVSAFITAFDRGEYPHLSALVCGFDIETDEGPHRCANLFRVGTECPEHGPAAPIASRPEAPAVASSKYRYLHVVQGNYGQGWEDLTASENRAEARTDLRAYRENERETPTRLIQRRELREQQV